MKKDFLIKITKINIKIVQEKKEKEETQNPY
jgi:hypothetical protein